MKEYLNEIIISWTENEWCHLKMKQLLAIVCFPHVSREISNIALTKLRKITEYYIKKLDESDDTIIITLYFLYQTRSKCKDSELGDCVEAIKSMVAPNVHYFDIFRLRLLNLCFTILEKNHKELLKNVLTNDIDLFFNKILSNPIAEMRQLSASCLSILHKLDSENEESSVYDIMCTLESKQIDVFNYREHLILYDKFRPTSAFMQNNENDSTKQNILRYLIGSLYRNFKLLWEPVIEIIVTYSEILPVDKFWDIFNDQLDKAAKFESLPVKKLDLAAFSDCALFQDFIKNLNEIPLDADHNNYRYLLWTSLAKFENIIDVKNRNIVGYYLEYYTKEYRNKKGDNIE